jgi:hypothetical protein
VSTVSIQGNVAEGGLALPAKIVVPGTTHATPAYVGAMKLIPGGNVAAPTSSNGVVIRAAAGPSTIVEVGTNGEGPNQLLIAGASGLSQVNDPVYNPVQPFVEASPGETTTSPEAINNANPSNSFRTIPLGNTPASYNLYTVYLDFQTTLAFNAAVPLIRVYLSDTVNGAYDETKAITSWSMTDEVDTGTILKVQDAPLIFSGVPAGRNLYINITFVNDPLPPNINANFSSTTTDYSLIAQKASAV